MQGAQPRGDAPACPDEESLAEFLAGASSEAEREALERHIDVCERCAATLAMFGGAYVDDTERTQPGLPGDLAPVRGERFAGRYQIRECVGFGAGGTVYAAYDPELERVVALKVLRIGSGGSTRPGNRWTREAKVMARVVHPNVVTFHDVGATGEHVFIATEFVEGGNLERWLAAEPRKWPRVLEVFVDAGRGLAAIHDAGLVHRDFKPHNVMVGSDGRVRVTDFGLARLQPDLDQTGEDLQVDEIDELSASLLGSTLVTRTRTGTLVGTPGYMSPEQWRGQPADARSDQFSFCVALYEALFGQRPFAGRTVAEIATAVCEGEPRSPGLGKVPRWLAQAVMTGLARDPAARFADMHALLDAITERPRRVRRRRATAALVFGFAGVAAVGYAIAGVQGDECRADERRLSSIWGEPARDEIRRALAGAEHDVAAEVETSVDAWVVRWRSAHEQACADDDPGTSDRQHELRLSCLDRRLSELAAAIGVLRDGDANAAANALAVVGTASAPERCIDAATLELVEPQWSSPMSRHLFHEIAPEIDRVEALRVAGRQADALAAAQALVERAEADGDHAVRAQALVALGLVQAAGKDAAAAEITLRAGVWAAEASGDIDAAATGWVELVNVAGVLRENYEEGRNAGERAAAAMHRLRDPSRDLQLASNLATLESVHGHYEQALAQQQEVLARALEVYGETHHQVARVHFNVAAVLSHLGRHEEALEHAKAGLAMHERLYPGAHPVTAEMLNTMGALYLHLGDAASARATLERAHAIAVETLSADALTTATIESNLAQLDMRDERYADAEARYRRVLAIYRNTYGPVHPDVALALHNVASARDEAADPEGAVPLFREALAIRLETSGPEHPSTANTQHNLGRVLVKTGAADEGIALMERALATREAAGVDPFLRASSRWSLARALADRGDTTRSLQLAKEARDLLAGLAPRHAQHRTRIEAWIAEREATGPRASTPRP